MNRSYTNDYDQLPTREKMNKRSHQKEAGIDSDTSSDRKRYKKGIDRSGKVRHYADIDE